MFRTRTPRIAFGVAALGLAAVGATAAPAAAEPSAASAAPALVQLSVVDATHTVFKGLVLTNGHTVTTASGGTHVCDGTNGGANPSRVPTPTAALDTAARLTHSSWDGPWYDSFSDYNVTTIAGETAGPGTYWNISVNGVSIPVGGCQFRIRTGDKVAFTITPF
ncbi:protein of unknown function [Actinacidiphila alni]|uniref:Transcobalamin-like C-terminal domain-containing protein n=1 Tax=Actinacidiphila alni TaxID=380248 RepID=A0A1I2AVZ6_9ACTN|nr:DUF4430 domain-containing protein [Actinacidiphila alni]SFE48154.1 protein of unknown function [Actinacidiphila alni]